MEKTNKPNADFTAELLKEFSKIVDEKVTKAVNKMFTDVNGNKLDTYELVRKFAMETIGVTAHGKLNPEFLKVVREEVANILAKEGIEELDKSDFVTDCDDCEKCDKLYHGGYQEGIIEGILRTTHIVNQYFNENNIDSKISITNDNQHLDIKSGNKIYKNIPTINRKPLESYRVTPSNSTLKNKSVVEDDELSAELRTVIKLFIDRL